MVRRTARIRRWGSIRLGLAASAFVVLAGAGVGFAEDPPAKSPDKTPPPAAVPSAARSVAPGSLLVHVDTKTLSIRLEPAAGSVPIELTADILNSLNTTFDGLTAEKKGNNTLWNLQGRYKGVWLAVTDADGKPRAFCLTSLPGRVAEAARAVRKQSGGVR